MTIVLVLYVVVCILLIIAVLLQSSKGSDLGSALGGGSGEMFGPKAPSSIMNTITTVLAASFLILALLLTMLSGLGGDSVMKKINTLDSLPQQSATLPIENTPSDNTSK